ncbi:MAG: MFS transporter [Eggerthellaceae bacterium]|nr:MFS transporter [Eggerthellaceae bacterium]
MTEKQKKTLGIAGVLALCFTNLAYMSDLIILPCYAAIFGHFADDSPMVTNFIASGTQLTSIVGALIAPVLMRYFSKKKILIVAFGLFVVQGCCTGLVDDAGYVAVMRGITGVFMGIQFPTAMALLVDMFADDDLKRNKYTGWFDGIMAGTGAVLMILGGVLLSAFGWQSIFWGYIVGVPIWIMILLFVPDTSAERTRDYDAARAERGMEGEMPKFPVRKMICIFIAAIAAQGFYGCIVYEFSMYLGENFMLPGWANGVLGAAKGVIGFIFGMFVFAPLFKRAKRHTPFIFFGAQAIAYFGLYFVMPGAFGIVWFLVWYAFIGIAFGLAVPYYHSYVSAVFPLKQVPLATSLMSIGLQLGAFGSTYFVTFLETTFNTGGAYTPVLPYVGACCVAAAVLALIAAALDKDGKKALARMDEQQQQQQA